MPAFFILIFVPMIPCLLAVYWKNRKGLLWYAISFFLAFPISSYQMSRVVEDIGGSPGGGSKLAILMFSSLISAVLVSLIVAVLPKKEKDDKDREVTFRI